MRRALVACLAAATWLTACNEDETPPTTARFNRPNRVAFACAENGEPRPLAACSPAARAEFGEGQGPLPYAFVTQRARGELATIDLDSDLILDSRRDIPGFTFVPVGETPVAIQVPKVDSNLTYVANYGSRDIRILDTKALVAPLSSEPTLDVFRLETDEGAVAPTDMLLTPEEDALLVTAPDAGALLWLKLTRCTDENPDCPAGMIEDMRVIPLQGSIDLAAATPPPDVEPSVYEQLCGFPRAGAVGVASVPALPDDLATTAPRPVSLALDVDCPTEGECVRRVLVADEALPLIHAIDLDALADDAADPLLDPLQTGVPTRAVAATPIVPAALVRNEEGDLVGAGETKYVYAIDALDGSVLALEGGRILDVGAGTSGRTDRIELNYASSIRTPGAAAIEVVTPGFKPEEGPEQWITDCSINPEDDPARLSGVFLAVALTDGSVRFIDVHDTELSECRTCSDAAIPLLVRNQQRLAINVATTDPNFVPGLAANAQLAFVVEGSNFPVRTNGSSATPFAPLLACLDCGTMGLQQAAPEPPAIPRSALDAGMAAMPDAAAPDAGPAPVAIAGECPEDAPALLCAPSNPWAAADDTWFATFEGPLPDSFGGRGAFATDSLTGGVEFTVEIDACAAGVLGSEDIAASYPTECGLVAAEAADEGTVRGDQLVINTRPLSDERLDQLGVDDDVRERCAALAGALGEENALPLAFEIRRAYSGRLVIQQSLVHPIMLADSEGMVTTYEDVLACMPQTPIAYSVRSLDAFTVVGTKSGFQHRVRANEAERCVVDPDGDPLRQSRAVLGCTFRNQELAFQLAPTDETQALRPGVTLRADTLASQPKLSISTETTNSGSVVPTQLFYNANDRFLYVVDINARGVIPIDLFPVLPIATGSYN